MKGPIPKPTFEFQDNEVDRKLLSPPPGYYRATAWAGAVAWRVRDTTSSTPSHRVRKAPRRTTPNHPTHQNQPHKKKRHWELLRSGKPLLQQQRSHSLRCSARTPANCWGGGGCTKPGEPETTQYVDTCRGSRDAGPGDAGLGGGGGEGCPRPSPRSGAGAAREASGKRPSPPALNPSRRGPRPSPRCKPEKKDVERRRRRHRSASLTPHCWEGPDGGAGRTASRESLASVLPHPVVVAAAAVELSAPRRRWAITLFRTRSAHSGNGKERPPSAQAPGERARSPALPLVRPSPSELLLRKRQAQTMKRGCAGEGGSHPQASPAADYAGVYQRPASTMKRTRALAGTATGKDYSSQPAVRQLQAVVGSPGVLRLVVSAAFTIYAVWEIQSFFFLRIYFAVLADVAAEGCWACYLRSWEGSRINSI